MHLRASCSHIGEVIHLQYLDITGGNPYEVFADTSLLKALPTIINGGWSQTLLHTQCQR